MKKNQYGFGLVVIIILIVSLGLTVLAGWYVWNRTRSSATVSSTQQTPKSNTNNQDKSFLVKIDPMVGGGFAGAVNSYEITATGEVFNLSAPDSNTEVKKSLLREISPEIVAELRQAFIESGVLDIASGDGPKYSSSAWTITINGKEYYFYDQSSAKFDKVKAKLKTILGENILV